MSVGYKDQKKDAACNGSETKDQCSFHKVRRNLRRLKDPKAFTLIELMIVVAIISIIAVIAIPNLLRSRMAANESAAVANCKAFAEAEAVYRRTDWDKDGILEYTQRLKGAYSLFEKTVGAGDVQLVDKRLAQAEGQPGGSAIAKAGYFFQVLTGQGTNSPGGAKNYFTGTDMTLGFGLSAVPASWDTSGRNSFQINNTATVYQKDRGPSDNLHIATYDPDDTWVVTE